MARIGCFFVVLLFFSGTPVLKEENRYCKLFGRVYLEDNPSRAQYRVFEEESESFADIIIFEEDNALYADSEGHWYFVKDKALADFVIYLAPERGGSDFSIYFTETESFAGCND